MVCLGMVCLGMLCLGMLCLGMLCLGMVCFILYTIIPNHLSTFGTIPVGSGRVRLDDGNSDNRANSVQLELELGLSLAMRINTYFPSRN